MNASRLNFSLLLISLSFLSFSGCFLTEGFHEPDDDFFSDDRARGTDDTSGPFSQPLTFALDDNRRQFNAGRGLFRLDWERDQVGPVFNAIACSDCHAHDGRGRPDGAGLLFRLSVPGPSPEPVYGGQFQPHGVMLTPGEGEIVTRWQEHTGQFADGTAYRLRSPRYEITKLNYGPISEDVQLSPRLAQQTFGLGLLEAIPEADIVAYAEETESTNDGIVGRPNWVEDVRSESVALGRFGWKAGQPTVEQQNAAAFAGDLGMTSSLFPEGPCTEHQRECRDAERLRLSRLELSDEMLGFVTTYVRLLAPPAPRNQEDPAIERGRQLFENARCSTCHVPEWTTGASDLPELSNQVIRPYTDLLLHDMGEDLADHAPEAAANGREWRTPPLWGLGLVETVNGSLFLLHDGRARNVSEAILWHGGEAEHSRERFRSMSQSERSDLIRFVESI